MEIQTNSCPCCGGSLLRHIRRGGVYWFCTSCCQEVPLLTMRQAMPDILVSKPLVPTKPTGSIQQLVQ